MADCGGLWQSVAADWDALRTLCRLGASNHRILGSSDDQILGIISGQISDHQLFGSAARGCLVRWWVMKEIIGRNSHTLELGELGGFWRSLHASR